MHEVVGRTKRLSVVSGMPDAKIVQSKYDGRKLKPCVVEELESNVWMKIVTICLRPIPGDDTQKILDFLS